MHLVSEALRLQLIPWSRFNLEQRVIVVAPRMRAAEMPADVQLSRRKITGKRVIVKNRRYYKNHRFFIALWPDDHLNEMAHAKLVCVLSGAVSFQVGEFVIHCGAGHFIFIPAGMPHPDYVRHNLPERGCDECELLYIICHDHAVQCWIDHCRRRQETVDKYDNSLVRDDHVTHLFRIITERMVSGGAAAQQGIALLPSFFEILRGEIESGRFILPRLADEKLSAGARDFEQRLREYLTCYMAKSLTVESVARAMYLSRAQFSRLVRRETGKTFVEILTECRLQKAKELLCETELTINGVAEIVGFKNSSYFRLIFHRQTGMTPGEFRRCKN